MNRDKIRTYNNKEYKIDDYDDICRNCEHKDKDDCTSLCKELTYSTNEVTVKKTCSMSIEGEKDELVKKLRAFFDGNKKVRNIKIDIKFIEYDVVGIEYTYYNGTEQVNKEWVANNE